jgi:hypothetical protein
MRTDRTALILIEEAIQLLRAAPATAYALYYAGTIPFVLALFSFSAEMSYSRNARDNCAVSALAMAVTYCWMKGLQAFCCRELVRVYTGDVERWWKPGSMLAIWARQIAFQPLGLFIQPLAWFLVFPVTYVSVFFHNLTVLGGANRNDVRKSWALARLWPKQSYAVYGLLSLLALIVFVDVYAIAFSIPFLFKLLFGIENFLTRNYTWAFSPVFLVAVAAVAYFLLDLLAKAIEVIRCCDGESLTTGRDLLRRLQQSKRNVTALPRLAVPTLPLHLLCAGLLTLLSLDASANSLETSGSRNESRNQPLTRLALDRQIEGVLQNPEFSWREKDRPEGASPGHKRESLVDRWMASVRSMLVLWGSWLSRTLQSLLKPFDFNSPVAQPAKPEAALSTGLFNALGYLLWAGFAGTLILFAIRILNIKATRLPLSVAPLPKPDLAEEEIEANQLPDNEWYALASKKMATGEFRQAERALFLAILSYLASHRLITVQRWKSNTDYEMELVRKAKHLSELPRLFAQSRLAFERCWYGAGTVTPEDFAHYHTIYERIKNEADLCIVS